MRRRLSVLFTVLMLLLGSVGLGAQDASAGASACALYGGGYRSGNYVYGTVQWNCVSRWDRTTTISVCLKNVTTGADLGCSSRANVSTSSSLTRSNYAASWNSVVMTGTKCEYGLSGLISCKSFNWFV